jgi:hypothetical protein
LELEQERITKEEAGEKKPGKEKIIRTPKKIHSEGYIRSFCRLNKILKILKHGTQHRKVSINTEICS